MANIIVKDKRFPPTGDLAFPREFARRMAEVTAEKKQMSEDIPLPRPPIECGRWACNGRLEVTCGEPCARMTIALSEAEGRQLYHDLERLLSERD